MRPPDAAAVARPLLAVATTVLAAGVVAAGIRPAGAGDAVVVAVGEPAAAQAETAETTPVTTSAPVMIELVSSTTITAPPVAPVADPPTTTRTVAAAAAPMAIAAPTPTAAPTTAPPPTAPPTTAAPETPPSAPAPPPAGVDVACERELVDRTNATRAEYGLPALAWDGRVHPITRRWSEQMVADGRITHNPHFGAEMTAAGIEWRTAGENVGRGTPATVFQLWMESPTHRVNILSADYTAFAVGCIVSADQVWVTQDLYG